MELNKNSIKASEVELPAGRGPIILGLCLCLGLGILGICLVLTAKYWGQDNRYITVRGLCEREVEADTVIWPIKIKVVSAELEELYSLIKKQTEEVVTFLKAGGVKDEEISLAPQEVEDNFTRPVYGENHKDKNTRYTCERSIMVYSHNIHTIKELVAKSSTLTEKGIIISRSYTGSERYLLTKLNDFKPSMIEEATINGRMAAQKLAKDSLTELGTLNNASQGLFTIEERDEVNNHIKKLRVVTTLTYKIK